MFSEGICQSPTLYNFNTVPNIDDIQVIYIADTTGLSFNKTGENTLWDYSSLKVSEFKGHSFFVDPQFTPYITSFNKATLAGKATDYYSYYYADTSEYSRLGNGSPSYVMICNDPLKMFKFPFSFGDQMTDSTFATYILNSKTHQYSGYNTLVADGWGTLVLPKNTYTNVLRLKRTQYIKDTASGEKTEAFQSMYSWYDGINNFPLFQAVFSKKITFGNPTPVENRSVYVSDLTEVVSVPTTNIITMVNIYPNPAHYQLNIELNQKHPALVEIVICDLLGDIVKNVTSNVSDVNKNLITIDISNFPKGMYIVKIITAQEVLAKSVLIQ